MAEPEKKDDVRATWSHGRKIGAGLLREEVAKTRDIVAGTLAELQAEIGKKKAILASLGRR